MSGGTVKIRNPYTGELDHEITPPSAQDLAALCARLRAAQVTWAQAGLEHRTEVMLHAAAAPLARPR
jgi:acyl-CoA reductase-like NAD-dependent aldehyde dehydrogenase